MADLTLTLSRRNLLSLLHKLTMPGSRRTIIKDTDGVNIAVKAVTDEEAYHDRLASEMHPETEEFVELMGRAIKLVQEQGENNPPFWSIKAARAVAGGGCPNGCCCPTVEADARIIANAFHAEYGL